jgi:hypothetical protein
VTARPGPTSGLLVGAAVVQAETQLAVVTNKGQAKLIRAKITPARNRDARMDEVFALRQGDSVATLVIPAARAEVEPLPAEPEPETVEPEPELESTGDKKGKRKAKK